MSFKPDVTDDNEERHKASPYIAPVQHRQADCEDCEVENSESIEMTQVQATNDSQGTEKEQLLAYMYSFCRSTWLVIKCHCMLVNASVHVHAVNY